MATNVIEYVAYSTRRMPRRLRDRLRLLTARAESAWQRRVVMEEMHSRCLEAGLAVLEQQVAAGKKPAGRAGAGS